MIVPVEFFLRINNYTKESHDFKDLFLSHPNYPSLYGITDTLDLLGVENVAAQVPKEQLSELPNFFLAYFSSDIVLVNQSNGSLVIQKEKEKKRTISLGDFLKDWDGIIVAIEPNTIIEKEKIDFLKNKYSLFGFILAVVFLLQFQNFNLFFVINFGLSLLGLFISVLIIDEKLNASDGVVSKICSFSENTSCDSVIKSDEAKLTKWLDFSDLPILFFGTSVLSILISQNSIAAINFVAVLSLPLLVFSIWLQKVKLKKWCVLCLGIAAIVVLQSVLFFIITKELNFNYVSLLLGIILVFPTWFFIKTILFTKTELTKNNFELLKFKRNFSVFNALKKEVVNEDELQFFPKIELGNPTAKVNLTIILSPSCGHCHTTFQEGLALIKSKDQKVKLSIFFNLNLDNTENPYLSIAENLLQINKDFPNKIEEAISDWHIKKMPLTEWKIKWEQKDITYDIELSLRDQYKWCLLNEYNYTPVKLLNNKLFPNEYTIDELKYFLTELEEEIQPEMV